MYIILAYDVNKKRVAKVMRICRKYLNHVQNSVFEGSITCARLGRLKSEIKAVVDTKTDSVFIYKMESPRFIQKDLLGSIVEMDAVIG